MPGSTGGSELRLKQQTVEDTSLGRRRKQLKHMNLVFDLDLTLLAFLSRMCENLVVNYFLFVFTDHFLLNKYVSSTIFYLSTWLHSLLPHVNKSL